MYIQFNILQLFYTMTELKNQSLFFPPIFSKVAIWFASYINKILQVLLLKQNEDN